ncbi:MAG: hypothetical protein PVS3B3_30770 [Ktedonobacteraceae bacterium]
MSNYMSKIAIVDLDGVVANSDARFAQATTDGKVNWNMALNGEYVHLDTLIEGAPEALIELEKQGFVVVFLTSRPDHMRAATLDWLKSHDIVLRRLEMKPASEQYTKTKVWKARRVDELAREYQAERVLVVEDEPVNVIEIRQANPHLKDLAIAGNLEAACNMPRVLNFHDVD